MRRFSLSCLSAFALLVLLVGSAGAGKEGFRNVPGAGAKALQMRTVKYNGSTNGRMVVQVRNKGKTTETFDAAGLYFVPGGDPEKAPQRLGAAGPFEVVGAEGASGEAIQKLKIAPGESVELELHVFCIDSHRSSPDSSTNFAVANKRMPKKLRTEIQTGATKVLKRHKNKVAPDAAAEIQSQIWETRDADWVKLEGERAHEKSPQKHHRHLHEQRQQRMEIE